MIRVRFAPSPTGHLHVGGARAAIFNWLFARKHNGTFLIRIEDTDVARSTQEFKQSILDSFAWLNMLADEPIVIQTDNLPKHQEFVQDLLKNGKAYKCYCSIENLAKLREEHGDLGFKYPGTCRQLKQELDQPFVLRFKIDDNLPETLFFDDLVKGRIELETSKMDDFVLVRQDGIPTYNLAAVVDDAQMNITHVIRGEDHIINTFKQILLYQAGEKKVPYFAHLPMILGSSGQRLSKREGAVSVVDYKKMGILPEALFNYLLRLGWSYQNQEIISRGTAIANFQIEDVSKSNAVFDLVKLKWLNSMYIKELSFESFCHFVQQADLELYTQFCNSFSQHVLQQLVTLYQPRVQTVTELAQEIVNLKQVDSENVALNFAKNYPQASLQIIGQFQDQAQSLHKLEDVENLAKNLVKQANIKFADFAKPLRYLLTSKEDGPSVFVLYLLLRKNK